MQNVHFVDFGERNNIMLQTVGVTESRNNLGELLNTVRYRGDTVLLLKSGTPIWNQYIEMGRKRGNVVVTIEHRGTFL